MRELKGDWRDIFHCFMIGLDPRKMILALAGSILSIVLVAGYFIGVGITLKDEAITKAFAKPIPYQRDWVTPKTVSLGEVHEGFSAVLWAPVHTWQLVYGPSQSFSVSIPFTGLSLGCAVPTFTGQPWYVWLPFTVGWLLIAAFIWAYFGGAITRIAAVEIAKDERIETQQAAEFARKKMGSYFWSFFACGIGFLFFFLCVFLVALVGRIPWGIGDWLGIALAVFLPLAILSGFIMALIAVGTALGFPLFYPAISAEGTDSFDAISRGFSYLYSRPAHYVVYQLVTAAFGVVSFAVVAGFGYLMLELTVFAAKLGMGQHFQHYLDLSSGTAPLGSVPLAFQIAGVIFTMWVLLTKGLIFAYVPSYVLSAQTMLYFLLRKKVDGIEMSEVYEEREEEAFPPVTEKHGVKTEPVAVSAGGEGSGGKREKS